MNVQDHVGELIAEEVDSGRGRWGELWGMGSHSLGTDC